MKNLKKETWHKIQETILIVGALVLWGGFELMCYFNAEYAGASNTTVVRMALIMIVTNLFTIKFTNPHAKKS